MGRRRKGEYSIEDIANAVGKPYRTVLREEKQKLFIYNNIISVSKYIVRERNRFGQS